MGTWFNRRLDLPTGESLDTGMKNMKNWWEVSGAWLTDEDESSVMVGSLAAGRNNIAVGDTIMAASPDHSQALNVKGIFNSGSNEDEQIYVPLQVAQKFAKRPGLVSRVEVSALTTPDNELARRAAQDPQSLSIKEWETWYCTAYVSAISYQIQEVITDSVAKPIRQVAESEGAILEKAQLFMLFSRGISFQPLLIPVTLAVSIAIAGATISYNQFMETVKMRWRKHKNDGPRTRFYEVQCSKK